MSASPATHTVLVLRHDTLETLEVPASSLRWFPFTVGEAIREERGEYGYTLRFATARADRHLCDVPFLRCSSDSMDVVRVTIVRGTKSCRRHPSEQHGWGRDEAARVKAAKLEQRRQAYAHARSEAYRLILGAGL